MKKAWERRKLSDLFQVGSSKRVLKSQWKTSGVPFYRGREVTRLAADGFVENELFISEEQFEELSKEHGVPKAGDIVITAIGTIGNSHVVRNSDRFYFKDASVLWMKRNAEVSSEFVNVWLKSPFFFDQLDRGNGATVDTLTIQKLQGIEISVPPLSEQRRIVGVLDEAFAGLATAQANAEKNLQNARALFESHLQSVFSQRGKGWVEKKLEEIGTTQTGSTPKSSDPDSYGDFIPFVKPSDFNKDGSLDYGNDGLSKKGLDGARRVSAGSVLMVCIGATIGKCGYCDRDVTTNQQINSFTPSAGVLHKFIYYQMLTESFQQSVMHGSAQATLPIINKSKWSALAIVLPPKLDEQKQIVTQLDALSAETQRLAGLYQQKLGALAALKKSLLHKAFGGEL
jgi:type I restriction enzyme S subunit